MEQDLVVGARVVYEVFGKGVIVEEIKLVKPAHEAHKTESQQLADILVQLGFKGLVSAWDYWYCRKKLCVYWDDCKDGVSLVYNNNCIAKTDGTLIAKNIKYFQKKLDKKLAQTPKQVPLTQELIIHVPDNVERVKLVTNLSNLVIEVDNKGVQPCKNL